MRSLAIFDSLVWRGHSLRQAQGKLCPRNASAKIAQTGNSYRFVALFVLLFPALTPYTVAQKLSAHAPASRAVHPVNAPGRSLALARNRRPSASRRSSPYSPYTSLPFPFFGDSFDPNDIYSTGYPVASDPPPFLLQAARAMAGSSSDSMGPGISLSNNRQSSSSQPLMIELQHGRYVRVSGTAGNGTQELGPSPAIAAASPPRDLPPALLIFRDGHTEEVRDYTIADGILYARGDYYTDGYWNKTIALSTLNLAQTLEANATRTVKFVLPSSPNEVITRP
jgi:hypothetical protein